MATEEEIERVNADAEWWETVAKCLGFRLYGWTYRNVASMIDPNNKVVEIPYSLAEAILTLGAANLDEDEKSWLDGHLHRHFAAVRKNLPHLMPFKTYETYRSWANKILTKIGRPTF